MTTAPLWPSAREAVASYGALMWKQVLLLGFDVGEYARKEGIRDADALGPRMFHSQSPNRAGLFAVLHFLFSKFSEDFARQIDPCFPTYDAEGKKEFRTVAMKLIQSMCDADVLPKECGIRAGSVLNVPEGTRAYVLTLQVSTAVVLRVLARDYPAHHKPLPSVAADLGSRHEVVAACRALQTRALLDARRFTRSSKEILAAQDHWMSTADQLVADYARAAGAPTAASPSKPPLHDADADLSLLRGQVDVSWRALDEHTAHHDTLQAARAVSAFLLRKQHPLSHRVDVGPLNVAVSAATAFQDGLHGSQPPILLALAQLQQCLRPLVAGLPSTSAASQRASCPAPELFGQRSRLLAAAEAAGQSVADIKAVNASIRQHLIATQASIRDLRAGGASSTCHPETPQKLTPDRATRPAMRMAEVTPAHAYLPARFDLDHASGASVVTQSPPVTARPLAGSFPSPVTLYSSPLPPQITPVRK